MKSRALISVFNKNGILPLAKFLESKGVEIVSTGGTFKYLKENGVNVIDVTNVTNFPEMLDGRVKTLHPNIHGGILSIRSNKEHMETISKHNIVPIDYVIVNLYPFFEKVKENLTFEEKIEFIDIGGPSMLRAAAKNFQDVVVISDVNDYDQVINEINTNGSVSLKTKKNLAGKVFNLTAAYDAAISNFLLDEEYPEYLTISYQKKQNLRYGENPHQSACFYGSTTRKGAMNSFDVLNGKELSFNNFKDVDIAWKAVSDFTEPACCALKHNTPCGFAIGEDCYDAYIKAYNVDKMSIFGGIVSFNRTVDAKIANELVKIFLEVIAAPEYTQEALDILKTKKNLRVIKFNSKPTNTHGIVSVDGGIMIQSEDVNQKEEFNIVTDVKPTQQQIKDMLFAQKVVKYVKSNAIVVANNGVAVGIGGGQVNRVWPTEGALKRGVGATVLASDAFFPFRDVVDIAAKYGIKAIIQPSGSIRDQESIDACNEHKIAMVFTGVRHFKH
ncbi:MAG: bifunctional phosphoribosylaminoimidazolecarboxamide formyltransferase/IMP cyclohydrolase [Mycoplasmataceae bacterium]|nr:bifunctional phosphoribosylaminoimidazolecarboxamide formyltransferase/IMP cyclohydrolase [Mycoplasmataceae bacterium]